MEVIISVEDGAARARDGAGNESRTSPLDFNRLRRQTIDVFVARIVSDADASRNELATLGEHLYDGLLTGDVEEFVRARLKKATSKERVQLRLKLPYPDRSGDRLDIELASYPWESLYSYELGTFVVQKANLVLSRYTAPPDGLEPIDCEEELRIGLVFANPNDPDLGVIDARRQIDEVEALDSQPGITVRRPPQPTPTGLTEFLRKFRPQVLHFIGHGGLERGEDEAKIVLVDPQGARVDVPDYKLADFFDEADHCPAVVLLDLPAPEEDEDEDERDRDLERNTARLGPRLIRAGVPAVVAMQYPFPAEAACKFSVGFYEALADGEDIDVAVTRARMDYQREVPGATESRMLGTPVLYAQSHAAVRRAVAGREEESEPTPGAGGGNQGRPPRAAAELVNGATPEGEQGAAQEAPDKSAVEVTREATEGGEQVTKDSWLRAVRFTGRREMGRVGLSDESKARLIRLTKELEVLIDDNTTGQYLADFIREEWVEKAQDPKLRTVAEAVEDTVRRTAR